MNIVVRAFQSLGEVTILAKGLTVLVGPSHRGKSAMIRAIQGALFNRPGTDFVRKGSRSTLVELTDVPVQSGVPLTIEWSKGGTKTNHYTVNGEEYKNVGLGTPQPVLNAGFRDVYIGDADKKKGEWLRPQVGSQFEPLFLLTRSPAFVADVLSVVQRRAVLTRAQDRCSSDVRQAKDVHKIRQADLTQAQEQAQAFEGLDELLQQCEPTMALARQIEADDKRASQIVALILRKQKLTLLQQDLTTYQAGLDDLLLRQFACRAFLEEHQRQETAWARYKATRVELPPLPASPVLGDLPSRWELWQHMDRAVRLQRAVKPLTALVLPPPSGAGQQIETLSHYVTKAEEVAERVEMREICRQSEFAFTNQLRAQGDELTDLQTQLATTLHEAKVCPICDRPLTS